MVEAKRKRENINQFYMDGENESNIQRKSLAGRAESLDYYYDEIVIKHEADKNDRECR